MYGHLHVEKFSGLMRSDGEVSSFGALKPFGELPKRDVRRLSALERGVVACLMGLNESVENGLGDTPIVLASRYGAMTNTLELLKLINQSETLSPTGFSLSVHNAAVGVGSQLTANRGGHTAIAAGERTLAEGLTESYARLKDGAGSIVLMMSDCHLQNEYAEFGDTTRDVQFALLLKLPDANTKLGADEYHTIDDGMAGVFACLDAVSKDIRGLRWKI